MQQSRRNVTVVKLCHIYFFVNIYSKLDGRRERTRNTELRPGVFLWVVGFRGPPARSGRSFGKGGDYPGKSGGNRSFAPQQLPGRGMARLIQPGWGKVLDETPAVHHHDAVAAALQYPDVVGDQQDGDPIPAVDLHQKLQNLIPGGRVQRGGRLVADQEPGTSRQSARNRDALALSRTQLRRPPHEELLPDAGLCQ